MAKTSIKKVDKNRKKYGCAFLRDGRPSEDEKLKNLLKKTKRVRSARKIMSTILGSGAYSDIAMENQIRSAETQGNLDDEELRVLKKAWAYRKKTSRELLHEFETWLDDT